MKPAFEDMNLQIPAVTAEPEDYTGEDGLLYCGKCQTPKEAFFAKGLVLMGKNKHPVECACHKAEREQQETDCSKIFSIVFIGFLLPQRCIPGYPVLSFSLIAAALPRYAALQHGRRTFFR